MSRYFIDRPIFAYVLAVMVVIAGLLSLRSLPIAQFPAIAPPAVSITANYPGADAQTLENTTTQIIEQQMKGIDHLRYFSSSSSSAGSVITTIRLSRVGVACSIPKAGRRSASGITRPRKLMT